MVAEPKIVCNNIWKVFGPRPEHMLKTLDRSLSRDEVQRQNGHVIAVKDVSFSVEQGETFVVMGLSGSGKSTLVRCLSRLIDPTEGQVLIDGQDITTVSHRELKSLGLDGWEERYPRELSGGMQQRVGLARAMAVEPEILLFDEPFSALDPLIRREMQDELLDLQARLKKTMVFITHDFLEAIKMGDHIMIMRDGAVSQMGTPEDIVANPVDKYVADFTEDVPRYKVLSAGKVMRPLAAGAGDSAVNRATVPMSAKIDSLINLVADTDDAVYVVDEQGVLCGEIDRSIVMKAMNTAV